MSIPHRTLKVVRVGGTFVCKLFDVFTDFTIGCIFILSLHFEQFSIVKPWSSRPGNSERFIVFRNRLDNDASESISHLEAVNARFDLILSAITNDSAVSYDSAALAAGIGQKVPTVTDIVDFESLSEHPYFIQFSRYIVESNNTILKNQIMFLKDWHKCIAEPMLQRKNVQQFCASLLHQWNLPPVPSHTVYQITGSVVPFYTQEQKSYAQFLNQETQQIDDASLNATKYVYTTTKWETSSKSEEVNKLMNSRSKLDIVGEILSQERS